ncbi:endonuclease-reverse transcriptase [Apostichopus japonicus]|uniref:Endonuclease-reverse transcriptase n=1 Tax=Stichopus japonicus TaxID=307972 RepID=A0A2G8KES6_STIJA|nr:endonuclease-reverse transcriptase [Apostichopus japonicus]
MYCFRTSDHLHTLSQVIEKAKEYRFNLCLGFIDYVKAFDSLDHQSLLHALEDQITDKKYIRLVKAIYRDSSARIHLEGDKTNIFKILKGVRQGDPISPKLFTAALENAFRNLDWQSKGIAVDGEHLTHLRFADDILLLSHQPQELQAMMQELARESRKAGLNMDIKKTKVMMGDRIRGHQITVQGIEIELVDSYIYLGKRISLNNETPGEVNRRIQLAWVKFGKLSFIFRDQDLPTSLKKQVFNQCIIPVLSYGAETWTTTTKLEKKLRVTESAMERIMIGVTRRDRVTNQNLREKTNVQDIIKEIKVKKWRWAGHLARQHDNRWTKKITNWTPRIVSEERHAGRVEDGQMNSENLQVFYGKGEHRTDGNGIDEEAFILQWMEIG